VQPGTAAGELDLQSTGDAVDIDGNLAGTMNDVTIENTSFEGDDVDIPGTLTLLNLDVDGTTDLDQTDIVTDDGAFNVTGSNDINFNVSADFNIGGGYGSTGVTIEDDGDISTDGNIVVGGNIEPDTDGTQNLGSATNGWDNLYLSSKINYKNNLEFVNSGDVTQVTITETNGDVELRSTTGSSSSATGALKVAGGVGISQNLYTGGIVGVGSNLGVAGQSTLSGNVSITSTTASSSSATGALVVTGGVGIGGDIYVGGNLNVTGTTNLGATTLSSLVVTGTTDLRGAVSNSTGNLNLNDNVDISGALAVGGGFSGGSGATIGSDGSISSNGVIRAQGAVYTESGFYIDVDGSGTLTEGDWRITFSGSNLVFQRYESSNWVSKTTMTP